MIVMFVFFCLQLNASDDRGIGVVRDRIQSFATTQVLFRKSFLKLVILDESDALTRDAQAALKRIIETYSSTVRFCFICNYVNKIIPAVQSRCVRFRFSPLSREHINERLEHIIQQEKVNITQDGKDALVEVASGDMRRMVNVLQNTHSAFDVVNRENVYQMCGLPQERHVEQVIDWLLTGPFSSAYSSKNNRLFDGDGV